MDLTGDGAVLAIDQNNAGLNSIAFTPTAAGQTTQFVAGMIYQGNLECLEFFFYFTAHNRLVLCDAKSSQKCSKKAGKAPNV